MSTTDWVQVFETGDDLQMEFVRGLLTTNGVPVVVQRTGAKDLGMIFGAAATGSLILRVPPDLEQQARDLLESGPAEAEAE
ncbi:MAG: hypothetical protein K0R39_3210 [Symbiobacteriaceae bacterium]|jgi:hypothetical protein|nr:hypothetical protein [Symbiobacteriaceae bacterium]